MSKIRAKGEDGITSAEKRFADEYLIDLNATRAAKAAFQLEGQVASKTGWKILQKQAVQVYIQRRIAERSERTQVQQDDVIKELARMGFANMADFVRVNEDGSLFFDFADLTREQAAAIAEVSVEETLEPDQSDPEGKRRRTVRRTKFKLHDKRGALESLAKHLGMNKQPERLAPVAPRDPDLAEMTDEQIDAEFDRLLGEVGTRAAGAKAAPGQKGKGTKGAGRSVRNLRPN